MNVEYINPFIEASINVINKMTGFSPKLGKVYIKKTPYKGDHLIILIGLTGNIQGTVVISLSVETARKIASAMMGGCEIIQLDELAKSAIGELCNMILGNTAMKFSEKNIHIDITPPTILTGDNIELSIHKSVIVCIPIEFEDNCKMEIDFSYIEK